MREPSAVLRVLRTRETVSASSLPQLQRAGNTKPRKRTKTKSKSRRRTRETVALHVVLREARIAKRRGGYEATVIREGPGNPDDKRCYTREALARAVARGLFEGLQCYADHPTASEEHDQPERSVRKLIGHFREARIVSEDGRAAVRARFVPVHGPGYEWVESLIESSFAAPPGRPLIGISINGYGETDGATQQINGRSYELIREIALLGSADLVTRTATGGRFHKRLQEAWRVTKPGAAGPRQRSTMKAETFQRRFREALAQLDQASGLDESDDQASKLAGEAVAALRKLSEATLTAKQRKKLPKADYAVPGKAPGSGSYPIPDEAHARDALARVAANGTPDEQAQVRAKVAAKYPNIKQKRSREASVPATEADTVTDTTTTDADAELRAQLDSERTLRETAERKLKRVLRAELTDRLLREANVSPEAAAAWRDEMIAAKTEKRMRKLVEARAAERQAILREAARDMPVEGVPFRAPAHASNPDADSGLLSRLGLDANDYAPAGA